MSALSPANRALRGDNGPRELREAEDEEHGPACGVPGESRDDPEQEQHDSDPDAEPELSD